MWWFFIASPPFLFFSCGEIDILRTPKVLFGGQNLPQFYFFQGKFTFFLLLILPYKHWDCHSGRWARACLFVLGCCLVTSPRPLLPSLVRERAESGAICIVRRPRWRGCFSMSVAAGRRWMVRGIHSTNRNGTFVKKHVSLIKVRVRTISPQYVVLG